MKTVNDIIWSDLIDDDTEINIFDKRGEQLTASHYIVRRFFEEVSKWEEYHVYLMKYYPSTNDLYLFLCFIYEDEIENDPT